MRSGSIRRRLPSSRSWPSTRARTPWPGTALKSCTLGSVSPRSRAAVTIAPASGCSEVCMLMMAAMMWMMMGGGTRGGDKT